MPIDSSVESDQIEVDGEQRDSEEFSAAPILELRLQTKFSFEPKVQSKAETTDYIFFSAKKPKGNNCLHFVWSVTLPNKRISS